MRPGRFSNPLTARRDGVRSAVHPSMRRSGSAEPLRCIQSSDCGSCFTAGLRSRETGGLAGVGTHGEYYGSSSYASGNHHAGYLNFYASHVLPLNAGARGLARSVRCVQHLRRLFFIFFRPGRRTCPAALRCSDVKKQPPTRNGRGHGFCQCGFRIPQSADILRTERSAIHPGLLRSCRKLLRNTQSSDCILCLLRATAPTRREPC